MGETYTCARCEKTYEKTWTDEEAMKETKENFGEDIEIEDCSVVCDDCYNILMGKGEKQLKEIMTKDPYLENILKGYKPYGTISQLSFGNRHERRRRLKEFQKSIKNKK